MGAKASIKDRVCVISGVKKLLGAEVLAEDLRGGMALVMASLGADGYSIISNADVISRGYYHIEEKLSKIGAKIEIICYQKTKMPTFWRAFYYLCLKSVRIPAGRGRRRGRSPPWGRLRESSCTTSRSRACPQSEAPHGRNGG